MNTIYFSTGNAGKFEDVRGFMQHYAKHVELKQFSADIPEIQSYDQRAVALAKARSAWDLLQKPVLVDDAGIYFERYDRFPGVLTKYVFKGLGSAGIKRLFEPGDRAYFLLYFVFCYGPDKYEIFESKRQGILVDQDTFLPVPSLPYDQFFVPTGSSMTYAEMRVKDADLFYTEDVRIPAVKCFADWVEANTTKVFQV
ncbi:MAG: hypothetical protein UV38_C0002G0280 [candidate division TM6 bacterium GW2011_GWE2_42_60]|nr:MAG: hypothetical protein UV38_C0002G0280 [candidate division TM6 bacterium GW2011_GWE2_42_60]HBY05968.1 hypothetical protein [Candidatus Dependentiae bacterium]